MAEGGVRFSVAPFLFVRKAQAKLECLQSSLAPPTNVRNPQSVFFIVCWKTSPMAE
jgi:hypothetical protein